MSRIFASTICALTLLSSIAQDISFSQDPGLLPSGSKSDHAVGVTDLNGDGKDDIVRMHVVQEQPENYLQDVIITFQEGPGEQMTDQVAGQIQASGLSSAETWGLCIADVDQNGRNDIIAGGFYNGIYFFKSNLNNSTYTSEVELDGEIFVQGIAAFDIDNDGFLDVFIADDNEISQILTNSGFGNFSEQPTGLYPETDDFSDDSGNYGLLFSDVDNNGHADLYISKCRQNVTDPTDPRRINLLFMNDGEGNWTSEGVERGLAIGAQSWSADFGDYDNDGDMDCFVGNHDAFSDLLINDGNGNFTEVTEEAGLEAGFPFLVIQTSWVDFNNDGFLDLITTGAGNHAIAINDGDGTFTIYDDMFGNFPTNSYALGDLNSDGHIDVFHTGGGYSGNDVFEDRIYLNDGNDLNYLRVQLEGAESNLNGVGARVVIHGPWGMQIRDVKAGESYGIQNSLTQHFGLGTFNMVEQLDVIWPSGEVDNFYDIDANQQILISEGSGVDGVNELFASVEVALFPNPASNELRITVEGEDSAAPMLVTLYNAQGAIIVERSMQAGQLNIDISALSPGNYNYAISSGDKLVRAGSWVKAD